MGSGGDGVGDAGVQGFRQGLDSGFRREKGRVLTEATRGVEITKIVKMNPEYEMLSNGVVDIRRMCSKNQIDQYASHIASASVSLSGYSVHDGYGMEVLKLKAEIRRGYASEVDLLFLNADYYILFIWITLKFKRTTRSRLPPKSTWSLGFQTIDEGDEGDYSGIKDIFPVIVRLLFESENGYVKMEISNGNNIISALIFLFLLLLYNVLLLSVDLILDGLTRSTRWIMKKVDVGCAGDDSYTFWRR
ncbi:hypothetical protein Tco_1238965 [Tanacetum coccineum]